MSQLARAVLAWWEEVHDWENFPGQPTWEEPPAFVRLAQEILNEEEDTEDE